jgi:hypothetical protein
MTQVTRRYVDLDNGKLHEDAGIGEPLVLPRPA